MNLEAIQFSVAFLSGEINSRAKSMQQRFDMGITCTPQEVSELNDLENKRSILRAILTGCDYQFIPSELEGAYAIKTIYNDPNLSYIPTTVTN